MLNVEKFSSNLLSQRVLWIFLISFTAILFVVTGWTQFSCYPMVTGGVLPKFCNSQKKKIEIIKDPRTHGNTLMILASNPESDESVLRVLTSSLDSPKVAKNLKMLQSVLAFNPKTPVDVLDAFLKSEDVGILENIAKRSNATPELLREVANNPYADAFEVQKALIENPQIPEDVLQNLAKSKEPKILLKIANLKKPSASSEAPPIFKAPANVLREVADNPVTNDPKLQDDYLKKLPIQLAVNQNTPEDVLKKLAESTNYDVLFLVTNNQNASTSVMEMVGENSITWGENGFGIQKSLASRDNVPRKIVEKLANSEYAEVLLTLSKNSNVPSNLKNRVVEKLAQNLVSLNAEPSSQPNVEEPLPNPLPENQKNNCLGKHLRNNFLGGAAAAVGFVLGGPVGASIAYSAVTGSMETLTSVSGCQF